MATIQPKVIDNGAAGAVKVVKWVLPTSGDVAAPYRIDKWAVTSFQIFGTTVTSVALNGSMEPDTPSNMMPLSDWQGNSLGALSAAGIKTPRDLPIWIGATLTTGSNVTILAACHRTDMGTAA